MSPPAPGSSILMTSAPRSASCSVAHGPAPNCSIARIRTSSRGRRIRVSVRCEAMDFAVSDDLRDIRAAVRDFCGRFDGAYWRGLEPDRYPEEFVQALTEHGWLAALIPEEYGGAGLPLSAASVILEEISA